MYSQLPPAPIFPIGENSQDSANYLHQQNLHNNAVAQQATMQMASDIAGAEAEFSRVVSPEAGREYGEALRGTQCGMMCIIISLAFVGGGAALIAKSMPKDGRDPEPLNIGGVVGGCILILVGIATTIPSIAWLKSSSAKASAINDVYRQRLLDNYRQQHPNRSADEASYNYNTMGDTTTVEIEITRILQRNESRLEEESEEERAPTPTLDDSSIVSTDNDSGNIEERTPTPTLNDNSMIWANYYSGSTEEALPSALDDNSMVWADYYSGSTEEGAPPPNNAYGMPAARGSN